MSHISDPPNFSSTCIHTCLYRGFVLVRGGFCSGVCLGFFVWKVSFGVVFCPSPFLSEYIHYNRKLNTTFNMYEIFLKCDVTCFWTPSPCHKLSHLLRPPIPSSMTYFMDGPLSLFKTYLFFGDDRKAPLLAHVYLSIYEIYIAPLQGNYSE